MRTFSAHLFTAALILSALGGCSDKPTRLYVLTADVANPGAASAQGIPIGVGPVTLPKYLDRPQVVTRTASNSLNQADLDQWGGNLADNITRVLATNLANLLQTDRVSLYPWQDQVPIDYQVTLDVAKFEQDPDGSTALDTFWRLVSPSNNGKVLVMRRSIYRENGSPVVTTGSGDAAARSYDAVAAAMSRDIEALSRDIASEIRRRKGS
jgi:uncharacterized lipoprotein YmbA